MKMKLREKLKLLAERSVNFIHRHWIDSDVDLFLKASLFGMNELNEINDPKAYMTRLRTYLEPLTFKIESVKSDERKDNDSLRFDSFLQTLRLHAPPIPFPIAKTIASYADDFSLNYSRFESKTWAADVAEHFRISSSSGQKARFLSAAVRFMRPKTCLEIGTCYGMSAVVIVSMLKTLGHFDSFDTIDGFEPMCSLSKEKLTALFGELVVCHKGLAQDVIPKYMQNRNNIDFVFHDAGHTREDFINDFASFEPHLSSGAVVIIDDINWKALRQGGTSPRSYEGWKEVIKHKRVGRAVEIDKNIGMMLLR